MLPRIAIPFPTSKDLEYNRRSLAAYVAAVGRSGGEPVAIDLGGTAAEVQESARSCDGVLLPGSPADVDPALYGEERDPTSALRDELREAADWILLEDVQMFSKPVLGICYGVQSLNVWRGGSLVQDLAPLPVNHAAGGQVAVAHTALVLRESLLGALVEPDEAVEANGFWRLPVNTSHHQALAVPGDGLRVVARCPEDGVIEAVELKRNAFHVEHATEGQFVLGVQWHPERSYEISSTSRRIFDRLIAEAGLAKERQRRSPLGRGRSR